MPIKKIFTVESGFATYVEREGVNIFFEHVVPREEFISQFDIGDISSVVQISYEPFRNLYHILDEDYNLTALDSVSEHYAMNAIHNNIDAIGSWFKSDYEDANYVPEEVIPVLG